MWKTTPQISQRFVTENPHASSMDVVSQLNLDDRIAARTVRHHTLKLSSLLKIHYCQQKIFMIDCSSAINTKTGQLSNGIK